MATGHYFQSLEKWTIDRDEAYDFGFVSKAMNVARKLRILDLELVLSIDESGQAVATPFEKFLRGLLQDQKHPVAGRKASRSAALA